MTGVGTAMLSGNALPILLVGGLVATVGAAIYLNRKDIDKRLEKLGDRVSDTADKAQQNFNNAKENIGDKFRDTKSRIIDVGQDIFSAGNRIAADSEDQMREIAGIIRQNKQLLISSALSPLSLTGGIPFNDVTPINQKPPGFLKIPVPEFGTPGLIVKSKDSNGTPLPVANPGNEKVLRSIAESDLVHDVAGKEFKLASSFVPGEFTAPIPNTVDIQDEITNRGMSGNQIRVSRPVPISNQKIKFTPKTFVTSRKLKK